MKKKTLISLLLILTLVLSSMPFVPFGIATAAENDFRIESVEVLNERVAIVKLNQEVSTHFEQMALGRANYMANFIKLDGQYLTDNKELAVNQGSRIYIRDDRKSFELVLGNSTGSLSSYTGQKFKTTGGTLQFDFKNKEFIPYYHMNEDDQQAQSGDVWARDIYDNALSEAVVNYAAGAYAAAPTLAVSEMKVLDNRAIYVKFNQRIVLPENDAAQTMTGYASLLNRAYAGGNVYQITTGGTNTNLAYSFQVTEGHPLYTAGNGSEFILYYENDIQPNTTYTYNWSNAYVKGLINGAGQNSTPAVSGSVVAPAVVPASNINLQKASLIESQSGKFEIELTFDRPFAYTRIADASRFRTVNQAANVGAWANKLYDVIDSDKPDADGNRNYYQALFETGTGMCGTVLTIDDVKTILSFTGVKASGVDFLDAFPGDTIVGSFKNSNTIVINNNNRLAVTLDAGASVSVKAGALVAYGTRGSWSSQTVTNPGHTNGTVGVINARTNAPRNTAINNFAVTKSAEVLPFPDDYDPNWNKGVTATESTVKFGHNDVYYYQYDGKQDPLVGGFDGRVKHSTNANQTTIYAPDGRGFAGATELTYVVQSKFPSIILENKYVKATIVPDQAARFLYFIFKPTGHDAFYTNPSATSYNIQGNDNGYPAQTIGGGTFVLGWLFVWGGTFPVFDGCEHGQVWTTAFDWEIKDYPDGSKSVICKLKNDQNVQVAGGGYVPSSTNTSVGGNFTPFGTGLEYTIEYKLANDSPNVDMNVSVYNPAQVAKTYEYYTCTTYAPGEDSEWGDGSMKYLDPIQTINHQNYSQMVTVNTGEPSNDRSTTDVMPFGPQNMTDAEAAAQLPQSIKDRIFGSNMSAGMNNTQGSVNRANFYKWDTMQYLTNHSNSTNFANDMNRLPQADYTGSVNLRNLEGVLRAGPDLGKATPGLKIWTWNYRQMFDNIPFERNSNNSARPYLEPWSAPGEQYFQNRAIDADETHKWTESYYQPFGIQTVTNATENAAAYLRFFKENDGYRLGASVYATKLEKQLTAVLKRNDTGAVLKTYNFTSKIMANEEIMADALVPAGTKVTLELYEGNTATGTPFFTAWVVQGQAFEVDRTSPVKEVTISHKGSIDIPGRVSFSGSPQYRVREVFAYCSPFEADGFVKALWTKVGGDVDELMLESSAMATAPNTNTSNWWHMFDYITLRGGAPGSSIKLRATAKDENIVNQADKPYDELTVNVKKPLYIKIPTNPGNSTGSVSTYARNQFSPYNFNLDMTVNVTLTKHDLDTVTGPINIEFWDRANEKADPFISFQVDGLGTHALKIPANTFPREEYYKIVARTANGDALGYEFFRVDGNSPVDWSKMVTQSSANINVKYIKKNSMVTGTLILNPGAVAYVNGVPCSVSIGTTTSGSSSNTNTFIIAGGDNVAVAGENEIEIVGVGFAQYPGYTFTVNDTYIK